MDAKLLLERLHEAQADGLEIIGPEQLAQALAEHAGLPLLLEDHPLLHEVAPLLAARGVIEFNFLSAMPADQAGMGQIATLVMVAAGAIPETGSLIITARSPLAFRLSGCPRQHIIIVPQERAGLTLAQALTWTAQEPSGLVSWLTGPSRTADIEKTLVLGAQGAESLVVLIYNPES
ncbi:MAG: hypothetical protein BZ151_07615 [Desulfobacca sp. 4484_104]|nr:MAG: hypothetical protein BZ151_07615 [Desulfobacca sp. 4484_104]RLA88827.1 MAG: hypothetical protein DRG58_06840 [Deltaproteobacteria bacterium]